MEDVYKRLARKLNRLPHGFPATESGVELKILRKIFSPEEAAFAVKLRPWPQTAERVARRMGLDVEVTRGTLEGMVLQGQIAYLKIKGLDKYAPVPFVVGIYEFQLNRLDKELADLFEEYLPTLATTVGGYRPAVARVVPVNKSIDTRMEILSYENLSEKIQEANSFAVRDCICRKERALQGHPCTHPAETCLQFTREPNAYDRLNYAGRVITRNEALELLSRTEDEGLVHATYNVRQDQMFVCNCCSCCCGFLRTMNEFHAPYVLARSNFVASVDETRCDSCAVCADQRCPMSAFELLPNGAYRVIRERCIGCGLCGVTCPTEAIQLVRRPPEEQTTPPKNIVTWSLERLAVRTGLI